MKTQQAVNISVNDMLEEVVEEAHPEYKQFREQAQLDENLLLKLEANFTEPPTTFDEYMAHVNAQLSTGVADASLLATRLRQVYNTTCVPTDFVVQQLQNHDDPIQWAIDNITSNEVKQIVDTAKLYWSLSIPVHDTIQEFFEQSNPVRSEKDFEQRCTKYITFLPEVLKNENSPKRYLAFLATEALQSHTVTGSELNELYEWFFSELRNPTEDKKSIVEKTGEAVGAVQAVKMDIADQFNNGFNNRLGEERAQRYHERKEEERRRQEEMTQDDTDAPQRTRRHEEDDYQQPQTSRLRREQRHSGGDYNPRMHTSSRDERRTNSEGMGSTLQLISIAVVVMFLSTIFMGVLKGILFTIFVTITTYGAFRMMGKEVKGTEQAEQFPPIVICIMGTALSIFTLMLKL